MKKIYRKIEKLCLLSLLIAFGMVSCKKNNSDAGPAPIISGVHTVSRSVTDTMTVRTDLNTKSVRNITKVLPYDSVVTTLYLSNQYVIKGENLGKAVKVLLNGYSIYFNPALSTENSIIITVPTNVPYAGTQPNKLTVITLSGTATFDLAVSPAPVLTTYAPYTAVAGDQITITGAYLNNLKGVKFDNTAATIVSSTTTQIVVKVPAGVNVATIYVSTGGGTVTIPFGLHYIIYDDVMAWTKNTAYGYSNTVVNLSNASPVKRGSKSIAITYTNTYGAFQADYSSTVNVAQLGLTALQLSVYGGAGSTGQVTVLVNQNYTTGKLFYITLVPGVWTTYTIPLSVFGSPATINSIVLQDRGAPVPETIYVDDIGLI